MRKFYTPIKDASIHSEFPRKNTGRDEILEVGKTTTGIDSIRTLMQFDIDTISASLSAGTIPAGALFDLKLYVARADDLNYAQTILAHQVSESWVEGTGYYYQNSNVPYTSSRDSQAGYFENDGVTWRTRQSGSNWSVSGTAYYTTGSSIVQLSLLPWLSSSQSASVFTATSMINASGTLGNVDPAFIGSGDDAISTVSATYPIVSASFTSESLFVLSPWHTVSVQYDTVVMLLGSASSYPGPAWFVSSSDTASSNMIYAADSYFFRGLLFSGSTLNYNPSTSFGIKYDGIVYDYTIDGVTVASLTSSFTEGKLPYIALPDLSGSGVTNIWYGENNFRCNSASIQISDPVVDITKDITCFIRSWVSGSTPNYGLVAKFPDVDESNHSNIGNIRFFSRNTHTIYTPLLIAKWNDQLYTTGALSASSNPSLLAVVPRNLRPRYMQNQSVRVDLSVRDQYPIRTFNTAFTAWDGLQRLPSSSYFSVLDQQSNTTIIPFDDYSRVSCDGTCSYAKFRTDAMAPGRYYKLIIKVVDGDYEQTYDNAHTFMVDAAGSV